MVAYWANPPAVDLYRMDGKLVASLPGNAVGDEHAIGAFLVQASGGSGKEWVIDASGAYKVVAPAAARLLTPEIAGSPLILDTTTAIIGCLRAPNGDCTATDVNLITGAVRPLLTIPGTTGQTAMAFGQSLTVLDVSSDLQTVWLREVTAAAIGAQGPTGRLDVVGIDLQTGVVTSRAALPQSLLSEQDLAITRDGKSVAGQEAAGTDSTGLALRHLHVVSLSTGVDTDVQGAAPYVGGQRSPSILFAPDGATVAWWGGVNNGTNDIHINVADLRGGGVTQFDQRDFVVGNTINAVFWLDRTTLVLENTDNIYTVQVKSGGPGIVDFGSRDPYILSVLE